MIVILQFSPLAHSHHVHAICNLQNALNRLLRYWELRRRVFGPDHYALPLTLRGAMKDSVEAVKNGFLSLLSEPDGAGRAILYRNCLGYRKGFVEADEVRIDFRSLFEKMLYGCSG